MAISNISGIRFGQKKSQPPLQVTSALLIVNRSSGAGRSHQEAKALENAFHKQFHSLMPHRLYAVTEGHDQVQQVTHNFLRAFPGPWLILSGGGSGTNRAQIQAIMAEVDIGRIQPDGIYMSALRLGSGNIIPRHVGLPADPVTALSRVADGLERGYTLPCCVYRCLCHYANGRIQIHYGATLASIGQFGRVPHDVHRWRQRHPLFMAQLLKFVPLETLNNWQYITFSLLRAVKCLLRPQRAEHITIEQDGRFTSLRLFSAMLINFDFPPLPFQTGCLINEPHLKLCLIPQTSRRQTAATLSHWRSLDNHILTYDVTPKRPIDIRFSHGSQTTLAIDEDTFVVPGHIRFEVGPLLRFVTGGR